MISRLGQWSSSALLEHARRMAEEAVNRNCTESIVNGLAALAMQGSLGDVRDATLGLAALYHSALKLGMNAAQVFQQASALVEDKALGEEMAKFPTYPDTSLERFWLTEVITKEGVEYQYRWPAHTQKPWFKPK